MGNLNCCQEGKLEEIDNINDNNFKYEKNWNDQELIAACEKIQNHWRKNNNNKNLKSNKQFVKNIHEFKNLNNEFTVYNEKIDIQKDNPLLNSIKEKHNKEIISFLGNNNINNFPIYKNKEYLYQGTFNEDDKKHVIGRIYHLNKSYYFEGNFENDEIIGKGFIYKDKNFYYIGEFNKEKLEGYGYYQSMDGLIYVGQFNNNEFNGDGLCILPNKKGTYKGQFLMGKKDGLGVLKSKNKGIYYGNFENDQLNGKGIYNFNNRNCYIGDFKDSKLCGSGIMIYNNGFIYEGEFKNGKKNGKGKLIKFEKSFTKLLLENRNNNKSIISNNTNSINNIEKDDLVLPIFKLYPLVKKESEYINIVHRLNNNEKYSIYFEGTWENDLLDGKVDFIKQNKRFNLIYQNGILKPFYLFEEDKINYFLSVIKSKTEDLSMSIETFNGLFLTNSHIQYFFIPFLIYKNDFKVINYDEFIEFTNKYYKSDKEVISKIFENINIKESIWNKLNPILLKITQQNTFKITDLKEISDFNNLKYNNELLSLLGKIDIKNTNIVNKVILEEMFSKTDNYKKQLDNLNIYNKLEDFIKNNNLNNNNDMIYLNVLTLLQNPDVNIDNEILKYLKIFLISTNFNLIDDFKLLINELNLSDITIFDKTINSINKFNDMLNYNDILIERYDYLNSGRISLESLENNKIIKNNHDFLNFVKFIRLNNLSNSNYIINKNITNNIRQIIIYLNNEMSEIILKIRLSNDLEQEEISKIVELIDNLDLINNNISLSEFLIIYKISNTEKLMFQKLNNLFKIENYLNNSIINIKDLSEFANKLKANII